MIKKSYFSENERFKYLYLQYCIMGADIGYYFIFLITIIMIIIFALMMISNKTNYYMLYITPDNITYNGSYVYITYTSLAVVGAKPVIAVPLIRTIYGYKNLAYNLSVGADCSFLMFNSTMFDWGRCN